MGWSPWARSTIARRRAASPTGPSRTVPSESGPRCTSVALIAARAAPSTGAAPSSDASPQIPHTGLALPPDGAARPHEQPCRLGDDHDVQAQPAVGDVLEVVR